MWRTKDFIGQKDVTIKHFQKKGVTEELISEFCTMVGIPIVVVCEFIMEEMPEHTELCRKKIKDIKKFYGVKVEETCGTCAVFCGNDHCVTKDKDED